MQIGIGLHDVNTIRNEEMQTMEARVKNAREKGFFCAQVALQKVIRGSF